MTSTFPQIDLQYLRNRKNYGLKNTGKFAFVSLPYLQQDKSYVTDLVI